MRFGINTGQRLMFSTSFRTHPSLPTALFERHLRFEIPDSDPSRLFVATAILAMVEVIVLGTMGEKAGNGRKHP
jgi:hypothetical protein